MRESRMQHPDEGTIHSWLDGALTAQESAEVDAHVQNCAECAAAVAEARGFIAGASRILTALDSVPSGVLPAANRRKGRNWPVWRAAAAIVVVALGSFVVLRDRVGRTEDRTSQLEAVPAISSQTTASQTPSASALSAPEKTQAQVKTAVEPPGTQPAVAPRVATAGTVNSPAISATQKSAATNIRENASASPVAGIVSTGDPARFSRGSSVVAMDAATTAPIPRDVGRRRAIGASSTLYEVSPGDTVVLTEATELRLESAVVTGVGAANQRSVATRGASGLAKSAAADTQRTVAAPQQTAQSMTQSSAQSATPPAAPTAPAAVGATGGMANPYNTITWVDSATGKRMSLSGRHSVRDLEEIRQKIARLRAGQSAEKKSP
jgi:anti-sigma factor RsiW